jgi:hypothetical protein
MKFAPRQVLMPVAEFIHYGWMANKVKVGYPSDVSNERLDTTLKGFHYVGFACLTIANIFKQLASISLQALAG